MKDPNLALMFVRSKKVSAQSSIALVFLWKNDRHRACRLRRGDRVLRLFVSASSVPRPSALTVAGVAFSATSGHSPWEFSHGGHAQGGAAETTRS
jgi:hypothetical protein